MPVGLFSKVVVVDSERVATEVDLVLIPTVKVFRFYFVPGEGGGYRTFLEAHWELRDSSGTVIWSADTEGAGRATIVTIFEWEWKRQGLSSDAVSRMIVHTFERISGAPEVRAYAASKAN